ncbi:503_t:CDS:1, partial [Funneliformis caledonium]
DASPPIQDEGKDTDSPIKSKELEQDVSLAQNELLEMESLK